MVDGLAMLKMNVLHLHLSDDQGFRFVSAAYPNWLAPITTPVRNLRRWSATLQSAGCALFLS